MTRYRLTPVAVDDIDQILSYLEIHAGPGVAHTTEQGLFVTFERLAEFPGSGHRRSDLTRLAFHFYPVSPYLIVYERDSEPLTIHAVLHAARDLPAVLLSRT